MFRFHEACGQNIILKDDNTVALRNQSFADAVVFSRRPLEENEIFLFEIEEHQKGWAGHLRCGITLYNPANILIPQYLLPDLTVLGQTRAYPIRQCKEDPFNESENHNKGHKIPEKLNLSITQCDDRKYYENVNFELLVKDYKSWPCDIGSRVGILLSPSRQVYFIVNGKQYGPCGKPIPHNENVYAVLDLYGSTKQVRIINCTGKNNGTSFLFFAWRRSVKKLYRKFISSKDDFIAGAYQLFRRTLPNGGFCN